ncbi:hypothetical protein C2W64_01618 [Brevibacillus laterosporus]|nr:hypothetical protein C2W64_01618 [Brevibacillus laterosporus]
MALIGAKDCRVSSLKVAVQINTSYERTFGVFYYQGGINI